MLISFLYISSVSLQLSTLSPFSWEVTSHKPKHCSQRSFISDPLHISRLPLHALRIMESPLPPEHSRRVLLGILRKTLGVDPRMTPCLVPGLWGTSQLGIKPVLAVSRILVVFKTGNPLPLEEAAVLDSQESYTTTQRETWEIKEVQALWKCRSYFFCVSDLIYLVSKIVQQTAQPRHILPKKCWQGGLKS